MRDSDSRIGERFYHPTTGLISTCLQRGERSSGHFTGDVSSAHRFPKSLLDLLDEHYRYKSLATQIPRDAKLPLVRSSGDQTQDRCVQDSEFATKLWRLIAQYIYESVKLKHLVS